MPKEVSSTRRRATSMQLLFWLRNMALGIQVSAVLIAQFQLDVDLPLLPVTFILAGVATFNIVTGMRLARGAVDTERGILLEILVDVAALTGLLYFTGGSTNPFTVFYLLPLTLAAQMLPRRKMWVVAVIAATCYTGLLKFHVPLTSVIDSHDVMMRLHVVGMWTTFLLSAVLIVYFVARMRDRDVELNAAREAMLRDQRVLAIGTMAAGAAHELGTPLTTIGVLAKELMDQYSDHKMLVEDLTVLQRQVDACRGTITNLLASAQQTRFDAVAARPVTEFVNDVIGKWRLMRPAASCDCRVILPGRAPTVATDETLGQALMNLLNNAADASGNKVEVEARWTADSATIDVMDRGPGFPEEMLESAGNAFFSTKEPGSGRGLGLFLARAAVDRIGGELQFLRREGGGSIARLLVPTVTERGASS